MIITIDICNKSINIGGIAININEDSGKFFICIIMQGLNDKGPLEGSGGVVATFKYLVQKVTGSKPTQTTYPERKALRILLGLHNLFWLT